MDKVVKFFFILLGLIVIGRIISQFGQSNSGTSFVAATLLVLVFVIASYVIKERLRRKKEGYYVRTHGGAEDGYVLYNEGGKTIKLYFSRSKDTIYVPSDIKWREIMPRWARERKVEIMTRIRKHIGKRLIGQGWTYEESDKAETLMTQN